MGKIADISKYQQRNKPPINWDRVAADVSLLILRVQDGIGVPDEYFGRFAAECEKRGIPYGVYGFFRAGNIAAAKAEAAKMIERVGARKPLFWVADIERLPSGCSNAGLRSVAGAWNTAMGSRKTGLYVSTALYPSVSLTGWDFVWIPRYGDGDAVYEPGESPKYRCDLHQYTSVGRVSGITGNVDLNRLTGTKPLSWFTDRADTGITIYPKTEVHRGLIIGPAPQKLWQYSTLGGRIMGSAPAGGEVRILAAGPSWYYVRRGPAGPFGAEGYVPRRAVRWIS